MPWLSYPVLLVALLSSQDFAVREAAGTALVKIGPAALPYLEQPGRDMQVWHRAAQLSVEITGPTTPEPNLYEDCEPDS